MYCCNSTHKAEGVCNVKTVVSTGFPECISAYEATAACAISGVDEGAPAAIHCVLPSLRELCCSKVYMLCPLALLLE